MTSTLKRLRQLEGLSQAELARRAGTHQTVISSLERGYIKGTSLSVKESISRVLGIDVLLLFPSWEDHKQ